MGSSAGMSQQRSRYSTTAGNDHRAFISSSRLSAFSATSTCFTAPILSSSLRVKPSIFGVPACSAVNFATKDFVHVLCIAIKFQVYIFVLFNSVVRAINPSLLYRLHSFHVPQEHVGSSSIHWLATMKLLSLFPMFAAVCSATGPSHRPVDFKKWNPPGYRDVRSPCPLLNSLANHDIIPHNGKGE
ncbi:hypothetical protein CC78DRAFT_573123 [Lojkania enalia]|uniref:Heme haloperoxidase family profile domain-containing protein n=1 Tax=Lojkania enalia TaxID=147567 RepID=A0A9P4TRA8_9PLEO|nr:hypothetical protein CC78DRAFT_573123 [Didymosphaeria enalia]